MRFKTQEVVRGISNEIYNIDGQSIKVQVAHMDVALSEDVGGKGFRTNPMRVESDEVLTSIKHNTFPMLAELDIEEKATKGKTYLSIQSITPLKPAPQVKAG
jgi:hypothetical protein